MAGAPIGGAEAFYERATIALHHAGDVVLPIIRRDAERAARLSRAGLQPVELAFGGALDLFTKPRVRRALQDFKPDVVMAWMQRDSCAFVEGFCPANRGAGHDLRNPHGFCPP